MKTVFKVQVRGSLGVSDRIPPEHVNIQAECETYKNRDYGWARAIEHKALRKALSEVKKGTCKSLAGTDKLYRRAKYVVDTKAKFDYLYITLKGVKKSFRFPKFTGLGGK